MHGCAENRHAHIKRMRRIGGRSHVDCPVAAFVSTWGQARPDLLRT